MQKYQQNGNTESQQASMTVYQQASAPAVIPAVSDLLDRFISSLDVAPSSRRTYQRQLKAFFAWLESAGDRSPDRETILRYKEYLTGRGLSSFSVSGYIVAVRKFFTWTEGVRLYPNIGRGVKGAKKSVGFRKDPLTVTQIRSLLASIPRDTLEGKRDYALLNLMVNTGLRTIEIERAAVEDIRQETGEAVLWIQGKGHDAKDAFVLLVDSVLKPIREYLSGRGAVKGDAPLFTTAGNRGRGEALTTRSIRRIVKARLAGIDIVSGHLTAHSLRHTAVTLALLSGATLQEAQALARHSDINTTLIYSHNISRLQNAPERGIDRMIREAA
jgi:integrase/recombinase XerC/integrase/recombinase XerD